MHQNSSSLSLSLLLAVVSAHRQKCTSVREYFFGTSKSVQKLAGKFCNNSSAVLSDALPDSAAMMSASLFEDENS